MLTYHLDKPNTDIFEDEERNIDSIKQLVAQNKNLDTPCFMSMVGSFENFLMIYKDVRLVWTAKLEKPTIYINRSTFEGVNGLIVTLSDDGFLQVSYLGTLISHYQLMH